MPYNRQYKTRQSGRYNTPGQFVAASDTQQFSAEPAFTAEPQFAQQSFPQPQRIKPAPAHNQNLQQIKTTEMEMKTEEEDEAMANDDDGTARPAWMKYKIPGVKKITKKERRRRQNAHLRRLIAPKNALMVLNEMMLNEHMANNFKVEPSATTGYYKAQNKHSFCADLTLEGQTYKGYGENKLAARNAAAEQAIRDLIIKRLAKVCTSEASGNPDEAAGVEGEGEETLPMIQIASFALHKLFSEWEYEGHKVPQIKPISISQSSDAEMEPLAVLAPRTPAVKKPKELPLNASAMHPSMLLSYMRPHVEYCELQVEGDKPQNMVFTVGVEVDGSTYVGKASNKKEARKAAARAACSALFGVAFDDVATANAPKTKPDN